MQHFTPPNIEDRAELAAPTWHDLAATMRKYLGAERARWAASLLHLEAAELSSPVKSCDWRFNRLIAQACQGFVDCPCTDCLDEIDGLLADELEEAHSLGFAL